MIFFEYFAPTGTIFFNIKLNNFRGVLESFVLADTSAKTKSLPTTCHTHPLLKRLDQALLPPTLYDPVGWDLVTTSLRLGYGLWLRFSSTKTIIRCKLNEWFLYLQKSTTAFSVLRPQTCDCCNGAEAGSARKFPEVHGKITAEIHRIFSGIACGKVSTSASALNGSRHPAMNPMSWCLDSSHVESWNAWWL